MMETAVHVALIQHTGGGILCWRGLCVLRFLCKQCIHFGITYT